MVVIILGYALPDCAFLRFSGNLITHFDLISPLCYTIVLLYQAGKVSSSTEAEAQYYSGIM